MLKEKHAQKQSEMLDKMRVEVDHLRGQFSQMQTEILRRDNLLKKMAAVFRKVEVQESRLRTAKLEQQRKQFMFRRQLSALAQQHKGMEFQEGELRG